MSANVCQNVDSLIEQKMYMYLCRECERANKLENTKLTTVRHCLVS